MAALYEDRFITCDDDGITIRWYYFPFGAKRIDYREIRSFTTYAMGKLTGQWRIWGMGSPPYWFSLDPGRPRKTGALILDVGRWIRPIVTPDDPGRMAAILREHGIPDTAAKSP